LERFWVLIIERIVRSNSSLAQVIGAQAGERVFLFLDTDDFERNYQKWISRGVNIFREKSVEPYGKVLVFEDLYRNLRDLIEPIQSFGFSVE